MLDHIQHVIADVRNLWPVVIHYAAVLVLAGSILNAALPPAISKDEKVPAPRNALGALLQKIRRSKAYGLIRQIVSMSALAIVWAKSFVDPKQRDQVQKIIMPLISILTAVDTAGGETSAADTAAPSDTPVALPAPDAATTHAVTTALLTATPALTFTLSGPVVTGLNSDSRSTMTVGHSG